MDGYDDDNRSIYTTPSNPDASRGNITDDAQNASSSSPTHRPERPRPYRRSSLPRALFSSSSSSIFGSGQPMQPTQQQQNASEQPPTLAVSPPSQENLVTSHPLSTVTGAQKNRESWYDEDEGSTLDRRRIPRVEKDADDINTPPSSSRLGMTRQESTTLTTLSRLFAVRAPVSPDTSRHSSYINPPKPSSPGYTRSSIGETAALPDHLYTRGLLQGRHSDITVHAFGHAYKLHRLILDRAPFFRSALSEPWLESASKETTLHPEDIDPSITQHSFELALKRLYGCGSPGEEDRDAVGLFTTGCWLEMQDLIDSSIESMLRQMTPETLAPLIKLVTGNYYGRSGDKILASAKAMLCRDGWRMPLRYWDGIPGDIVREIVGGDGFFIDGEWDRWLLAKTLLDRRLKRRAIEAGLVEQRGRKKSVLKAPDAANLMAVRFDTIYRRNSGGTGRGMPENLHRWVTLYTHPDVEAILVLLDEGIHYLHLDFEQLQFIRNARDILGLPVMPEKVISTALWQQMELRQRVVNAREVDMELDLSVRSTEDAIITNSGPGRDTAMNVTSSSSPDFAKGKQKVEDVPDTPEEEFLESGSWDGNGKPRKFWIPSSDCNIVMGGNADPVIATSNNTTLQRHASRLSATIQPEDVQWASDFAAVTSQPRQPPPPPSGEAPLDRGAGGTGIGEVRYTHFPPFRFAAEFPNPRLLKEKKRVYSRTVFYAGSLWNIYIQKVASSRTKQLGVYLHRAKEREMEEVIAGTSGVGQGSVDERIGLLERELLLRNSERHERRQRRRGTVGGEDGVGGAEAGDGGESSDFEADATAPRPPINPPSPYYVPIVRQVEPPGPSVARSNTVRNLLPSQHRKLGQTTDSLLATSPPSLNHNSALTPDPTSDDLTPASDDDSEDDAEDAEAARFASPHVPTLPAYVDQRPTIKTYFKIYSPSRGGRMLSVYESAPDRFNFSQSWGWKSSTLMLDEGLLGEGMVDDGMGEGGEVGEKSAGFGLGLGGSGGGGRERGGKSAGVGRADGKLRFMVVIGNI